MNAKQLRQMLQRRDRMASDLAALDKRITQEGRKYWAAKGVLANPRPERLRAELLGLEDRFV